jgi:hypothetical protein
MSQALVQTSAEINVSGGTSGNVTLNGVAAGDLLTAMCINLSNGTDTFSVSDGKNTWQSAVTGASGSGVPPQGVAQILYAQNVAAGNTTVTITATHSITFQAFIQEWSGSATSSVVAATDSHLESTAGTSHTASNSGISPGSPCICLACGTDQSGGSPTAGSGYTQLTSSQIYDLYEFQIFSSAPTNEHGAWTTSSGQKTISCIAAFKAASGSGASAPGAFIGGGMGSFIG